MVFVIIFQNISLWHPPPLIVEFSINVLCEALQLASHPGSLSVTLNDGSLETTVQRYKAIFSSQILL